MTTLQTLVFTVLLSTGGAALGASGHAWLVSGRPAAMQACEAPPAPFLIAPPKPVEFL